jgi:hypothetical protein
MDIRTTLAALLSSPQFEGSLTANTQAAYDRLRWLDARPKPSWADLVAKWPEVEAALNPPDPQSELDAAISAATSWQELQAALLGDAGRAGRVAGRPA